MSNNTKKKSLVSNQLTNSLKSSVFAKAEKPTEPDPKPTATSPTHNVVPHSGTKAPQPGATAPDTKDTAPTIDVNKLQTIIEEMSQIKTKRDGLNVRLSEQETQDIDDFILDKLRKKGIKGYEVSAAKLMRYAFRYLSRVHEKEFIKALEKALEKDTNLSI
ncbi:MAG: hypothetical protein R3A44_25855 [Caldilineaceae bacterium]